MIVQLKRLAFKIVWSKALVALLLFLFVVKGLSGLNIRVIELDLLTGFNMLFVCLLFLYKLYYLNSDNTFILADPIIEIFLTIKIIFRGFKLAFDIQINFFKSELFLDPTGDFLHCKIETFLFKYIRLPVGVIHIWKVNWDPLTNHLSWKHEYVSLRQVVWFNFVLNVIRIFLLSFLKMPVKVLRKIVQIQRSFMWGDIKGEPKIYWVSWANVCKPMSKCGLGVRDFRLVNLTVLAKWMRCIISCASGLWEDVFLSYYVTSIAYSLRSGRVSGFRKSSSWWKLISLIYSK